MKYAYEDLGPDQFEKLIVLLCQRLLGFRSRVSRRGLTVAGMRNLSEQRSFTQAR